MKNKAAQPNNPRQINDIGLRQRLVALELKVEQLTKALKEQGLGSIESGWLRDNNTKLNK